MRPGTAGGTFLGEAVLSVPLFGTRCIWNVILWGLQFLGPSEMLKMFDLVGFNDIQWDLTGFCGDS
jgi:hypothetical protein